jgi:glutamyl-tRNA synthetase
MLRAVQARLDGIPVFDVRSVEEAVRVTAEQRGVGSGKIIHPLRLALTGVSQGPGLFELMTVLGKETCLRRIGQALQTLG